MKPGNGVLGSFLTVFWAETLGELQTSSASTAFSAAALVVFIATIGVPLLVFEAAGERKKKRTGQFETTQNLLFLLILSCFS